MNGAEVIVSVLRDAGVEVVFGLPGVHNLALWERCRAARSGSSAYATSRPPPTPPTDTPGPTGRLGVAITTTGPGAANTLGAVGEAWASRSSILVIATDIATTLRRPGAYRGVLHETVGQEDLFRPVTKRVLVVPDAVSIAETVRHAAEAAESRHNRRPVYVQVPTDLLAADATEASRRRPMHHLGNGSSHASPPRRWPCSPERSGRCSGSAVARSTPRPRSPRSPSCSALR